MNQLPEIPCIEAADNPWGVPVLDVRAVTEHTAFGMTIHKPDA